MIQRLLALIVVHVLVLYASTAQALFLTPDTLAPSIQGVGTNRYGYSEGDPINRSDPLGHLWNDTSFSRGWDSVFGEGSWDNTAVGRAETYAGAAIGATDSVGYGFDNTIDLAVSHSWAPIGVAIEFAAPNYGETREGVVGTYNSAVSGDLLGAAAGLAQVGIGVLGGKGRLIDDGVKFGKDFFRGARPGELLHFTPGPREFRVDPDTGYVRPTHGISVYDNPDSIIRNGREPFMVDQSSIPDSLTIIQRGNDPRHYEIVPVPGANLTPDEYIQACQSIVCIGK